MLSINTKRVVLTQRACVCAKSLQGYMTFCDPMDYSTPRSSVHGILQARIWEWIAVSFWGVRVGLLDPGIEPASLMSPALPGAFFTSSITFDTAIKVKYLKEDSPLFCKPWFLLLY